MPDRPKPRWYHLTPDRFLVGLLLVVGVLFLSEWFVWFPFNEKKGWAVLIGMGSVCGALLLMLVWFIVALIFRRRFQFGIRSLLVFVLVCAVVCSWFTVRMEEARRQREAVTALRERRGVTIRYLIDILPSPRMPPPSEPNWLVKELGVDFFDSVVEVHYWFYIDAPGFDDEDLLPLSGLSNLKGLSLAGTPVTDSGFIHLKGLTNLRTLDLRGTQLTGSGLEHLRGLSGLMALLLNRTPVTDSNLDHLEGLVGLQTLDLTGTQITDSGLKHLEGLTRLEALSLAGTQVTDSGLERLKGLANLRTLDLRGTQIGDSGLKHLRGLTKVEWLSLAETQVTDSGLEHLKGLPRLEGLWLDGTQVTDSGLVHLKGVTGLATLSLNETQVTDSGLVHLKGLTKLEGLYLDGTQVTSEGFRKLHQSLYLRSVTRVRIESRFLVSLSGYEQE